MFLSTDEFYTHLYAEVIDAVSREDETILASCIDAAISEMKGYLSGYNVAEIFSQQADFIIPPPATQYPLIKMFAKDITIWHFLNLSNPSADLELRKVRYERAIEWLKGVQKGAIVPDLPVAGPLVEGEQTGSIRFGSNAPRENHF